jgi:hypothetical protein
MVVFRHTRTDGQYVGVEDDVLGRDSRLFRQESVRALTDSYFAFVGIGLSFLVEGHDDDGGAIAAEFTGVGEEGLLSFFEGDGVDDTFPLDAF